MSLLSTVDYNVFVIEEHNYRRLSTLSLQQAYFIAVSIENHAKPLMCTFTISQTNQIVLCDLYMCCIYINISCSQPSGQAFPQD